MKIKKKSMFAVILAMMMLILGAVPVMAATSYQYLSPTFGVMSYARRNKIVTTVSSKTTKKNQNKRKVGRISVSSNGTTASGTFSVSESVTYSLAAGVPVSIIQKDCNISVSKSTTVSKGMSLTASAKLKKGKSKTVYVAYDIVTIKYKHVIQTQQQNIWGKWVNVGKPTVKYTIKKIKTPVLLF